MLPLVDMRKLKKLLLIPLEKNKLTKLLYLLPTKLNRPLLRPLFEKRKLVKLLLLFETSMMQKLLLLLLLLHNSKKKLKPF